MVQHWRASPPREHRRAARLGRGVVVRVCVGKGNGPWSGQVSLSAILLTCDAYHVLVADMLDEVTPLGRGRHLAECQSPRSTADPFGIARSESVQRLLANADPTRADWRRRCRRIAHRRRASGRARDGNDPAVPTRGPGPSGAVSRWEAYALDESADDPCGACTEFTPCGLTASDLPHHV